MKRKNVSTTDNAQLENFLYRTLLCCRVLNHVYVVTMLPHVVAANGKLIVNVAHFVINKDDRELVG